MADRISRIRVRGFRCLADVTLDLDGLTVLIGENGSGKSSLVEVCEVLRHLGARDFAIGDLLVKFPDVWRVSGKVLELEVHVERRVADRPDPDEPDSLDSAPPLRYLLRLWKLEHGQVVVLHEELRIDQPDLAKGTVLQRTTSASRVYDPAIQDLSEVEIEADRTLLGAFRAMPRKNEVQGLHMRAIERVGIALQGIEVHVPFEVTPAWVAQQRARRSDLRESLLLQPAHRLELLGTNLINALHRLINVIGGGHWEDTLEILKLGLGRDLEGVIFYPDPSGGRQSLALRFRGGDGDVPASGLSDGQLSFLAFVALLRLPRPERSLLVFDEVERHLHPGLLGRVFAMFESLARHAPVLLTTHSDRLLDWVADPVQLKIARDQSLRALRDCIREKIPALDRAVRVALQAAG
jgi:energy-coupling factor transporter ATP-binding protein EcfA2